MTESFISGFGVALGILAGTFFFIMLLMLIGFASNVNRRRRRVKRKNARKN